MHTIHYQVALRGALRPCTAPRWGWGSLFGPLGRGPRSGQWRVALPRVDGDTVSGAGSGGHTLRIVLGFRRVCVLASSM